MRSDQVHSSQNQAEASPGMRFHETAKSQSAASNQASGLSAFVLHRTVKPGVAMLAGEPRNAAAAQANGGIRVTEF